MVASNSRKHEQGELEAERAGIEEADAGAG